MNEALNRLTRELFAGMAPENPRGATFGRFTLVRQLGTGGMASVQLAWDRDLQRYVALKLLHPGSEERLYRRFRCEAQAAARIRHPNLVTVHEVGEIEGRPYLVMELVDGQPLDVARPRDEVVALLRKVALGLHEAHRHAVIHRDLKPQNILVDGRGEPRVVDFGLAYLEDAPMRLTRDGGTLGTPLYMAPEQIDGREVGPRTDVYALGVILYEMLAGAPPHQGKTPAEVYKRILHEDVTPPRGPQDLVTICLKAMRRDPSHRYASAADLAEDLRKYLEREPISARRPSVWQASWKWIAKRKGLLATSALTAAAATVAILFLYESRQHSAAAAGRERARVHLDSGRRALESIRLRLRDADYSAEDLLALARGAEAEFRKALDECPNDADAYLGMGRAYALAGREEEAIGYLNRSIAASATYAPPYLERARLRADCYEKLRHDGDGSAREETEEAQKLRESVEGDLRKVEEHAAEKHDSLYGRAILAFAHGEFESAERLLQQYAQIDPMDGPAHYWRGHALLHLKRYEDAEAPLTRAIELDARSYRAYLGRGIARRGKWDLQGAIADCDAAIRLAPEFPSAFLNRGNAKLNAGNVGDAIEDYTIAIGLDPQCASAFINRATARCERGDLDGAKSDCEAFLSLKPASSRGYAMLAMIRAAKGDSGGAIADANTAIGLNPKEVDAYVNRGCALGAKGDLKGAIADYDTAIQLDPRCVLAYRNRGNARRLLGDLRGAVDDFKLALEHAPPNWPERAKIQAVAESLARRIK